MTKKTSMKTTKTKTRKTTTKKTPTKTTKTKKTTKKNRTNMALDLDFSLMTGFFISPLREANIFFKLTLPSSFYLRI